MANTRSVLKKNLYRLWAVPLLAGGALYAARAVQSSDAELGLLGAGMVLGGTFALRHNLLDLSPRGLDPRQTGVGWVALLGASALLVLASAALRLAA